MPDEFEKVVEETKKDDEPIMDIKVSWDSYEAFIRRNRVIFGVIFAILAFASFVYLIANFDTAFTKTVHYTTPDGLYNCNETYKYGKNITPLCVLPTMDPNVHDPNFIPVIMP
jgi:hypothetical protein